MSRITITMLLACFGSLVPAWIGSALLPQLAVAEPIFDSATGIFILALFALSFWGTSFAHFYLKSFKYGILSGLGKWTLILLGIWIYYASNGAAENQHPYIIFIGILFAAIWGFIDFGMLYHLAKNRSLED